jgi:Tol biopolymer transport system component
MPKLGTVLFRMGVILPPNTTISSKAPVCELYRAGSPLVPDTLTSDQANACFIPSPPQIIPGTQAIDFGSRFVETGKIFQFIFWIRASVPLINAPLIGYVKSDRFGWMQPGTIINTNQDAYPAPSAGKIVYEVWGNFLRKEFRTARFDGTGDRLIDSGQAGFQYWPKWMPDERIVFGRKDQHMMGPGRPWLMKADGTSKSLLFASGPLSASTADVGTPRISRDGAWWVLVARTASSHTFDVWTARSDGTEQTPRTKDANIDWGPVWCGPDLYAFIANTVNGVQICKLSLDQSYFELWDLSTDWRRTNLASHPSHDVLAFTAEASLGGHREVHLWDRFGGERRLCDGFSPTYSKDGQWIFFLRRTNISSNNWRISLYRIDLSGKRETEVIAKDMVSADCSLQ